MTCERARYHLGYTELDRRRRLAEKVFTHINGCPYCTEWVAAECASRGIPLAKLPVKSKE